MNKQENYGGLLTSFTDVRLEDYDNTPKEYEETNPCYATLPKDYVRQIPKGLSHTRNPSTIHGRRFIEGTEEYFHYMAQTHNYPQVGFKAVEQDGMVNINVPTDRLKDELGDINYRDVLISKNEYEKAKVKHNIKVKTLKKYFNPQYMTTKPYSVIKDALLHEAGKAVTNDGVAETALFKDMLRKRVNCKCQCADVSFRENYNINGIDKPCSCECHNEYDFEVEYNSDAVKLPIKDTTEAEAKFSESTFDKRNYFDKIETANDLKPIDIKLFSGLNLHTSILTKPKQVSKTEFNKYEMKRNKKKNVKLLFPKCASNGLPTYVDNQDRLIKGIDLPLDTEYTKLDDSDFYDSETYKELMEIKEKYSIYSKEYISMVNSLRFKTKEMANKFNVVVDDESYVPNRIRLSKEPRTTHTKDGVRYIPAITLAITDIVIPNNKILTLKPKVYDVDSLNFEVTNFIDDDGFKVALTRDNVKQYMGDETMVKTDVSQEEAIEIHKAKQTGTPMVGFVPIPDFITDTKENLLDLSNAKQNKEYFKGKFKEVKYYEGKYAEVGTPKGVDADFKEELSLYRASDEWQTLYFNEDWDDKQIAKAIREQMETDEVTLKDGKKVKQAYIAPHGEEYIEVGPTVNLGNGLKRKTYRVKYDEYDEKADKKSHLARLERGRLIMDRIKEDESYRRLLVSEAKRGLIKNVGYEDSALRRALDAKKAKMVKNSLLENQTFKHKIGDPNEFMRRTEQKIKFMETTLSKEDIMLNLFVSMVIQGRLEEKDGGLRLNKDLPQYIIDKGEELENLVLSNEQISSLLVGSHELLKRIEDQVIDVDITTFIESLSAKHITKGNFITEITSLLYNQTSKLERAMALEACATGKDRYGLSLQKSSEALRKELSKSVFRNEDILGKIANADHTDKDALSPIAITKSSFNERRNLTLTSILNVMNAELENFDLSTNQRLLSTADRLVHSTVVIPLNVIVSLYKAHEFNLKYKLNLGTLETIKELLTGIFNMRAGIDGDTDLSKALKDLATELVASPEYTADQVHDRIETTIKDGVRDVSYYRTLELDDYKSMSLRAEDQIVRKTPAIIDSQVTSELKALHFIDDAIYEVKTILARQYYKSITSGMVLDTLSSNSKSVKEMITDAEEKLMELKTLVTREDKAKVGRIVLDSGEATKVDFDAIEGEGTDKIYYKIGYEHLNTATKGGLRSGDLVVVGALSSNYKTGMTMGLFMSVILYNKAPEFNGKRSYAVWASLEDDAQLIIRQMAQFVYFAKHRYHLHADSLSTKACYDIVVAAARENGWTFMFTREDASTTGYQEIFKTVEDIEERGGHVGVMAIDYIEKMSVKGCKTGGPIGEDKTDLVSRLRYYFASRNALLMSPWQLSAAAGNVVKSGIDGPDLVKEFLNKPFYKGVSNLNTEIDLEVIANKTYGEDGMPDVLTVGRGKAKVTRGVSSADLIRHYPFNEWGPLEYDVILETDDVGNILKDSDGNPKTKVIQSSYMDYDAVANAFNTRNGNGFYALGCDKGFKAGITDGAKLQNDYLINKAKQEEKEKKNAEKFIDGDISITNLDNLNKEKSLADKLFDNAKTKSAVIKAETMRGLKDAGIQQALKQALHDIATGKTTEYRDKVANGTIMGDKDSIKYKSDKADEFVELYLSNDGKFKTYEDFVTETSDKLANDILSDNIKEHIVPDIDNDPLVEYVPYDNDGPSLKVKEFYSVANGAEKEELRKRMERVKKVVKETNGKEMDKEKVRLLIESAWSGTTPTKIKDVPKDIPVRSEPKKVKPKVEEPIEINFDMEEPIKEVEKKTVKKESSFIDDEDLGIETNMFAD